MEYFFRFIASPKGRGLRVIAGIILIGASTVGKEKTSWPLLLAGLVSLYAGFFDKCVLAPLAGKPFSGKQLRQRLK